MTAADRDTAAPHADRGRDLYETPSEAIEMLMRVEHLPAIVWEPAAGRGALAAPMRAAGITVIASDVANERRRGIQGRVDFFKATAAPHGCNTLVTNPPYMIADAFIAHALDLCERVMILQRLGYIAGLRWYSPNHDPDGRDFRRHLARVHVFSPRLPPMHRDGWQGPKVESATRDFVWLVWDRRHIGGATLNWIDHRTLRTR